MTRLPSEIDHTKSVRSAWRTMQEEKIGHLPVMAHGRLYGIVSERDLRAHRGSTPVGEICERAVVAVPPTATVVDAALKMLRLKVGSVVVVDAGVVVGIFSGSDALAALIGAYRPELRGAAASASV